MGGGDGAGRVCPWAARGGGQQHEWGAEKVDEGKMFASPACNRVAVSDGGRRATGHAAPPSLQRAACIGRSTAGATAQSITPLKSCVSGVADVALAKPSAAGEPSNCSRRNEPIYAVRRRCTSSKPNWGGARDDAAVVACMSAK